MKRRMRKRARGNSAHTAGRGNFFRTSHQVLTSFLLAALRINASHICYLYLSFLFLHFLQNDFIRVLDAEF
jgi:hypothetical protein